MARIVEREVVPVVTEERESTASNFIWALAFIIVVGLIVGALYYSGFLRRITQPRTQQVDINVTAPAR